MTDLAQIPERDGATYVHERDGFRLAEQHQRVWNAMRDGKWRTPKELELATGDSWASISARLRDFRKDRFGAHGVDRESRGNGLFVYRLRINKTDLFE